MDASPSASRVEDGAPDLQSLIAPPPTGTTRRRPNRAVRSATAAFVPERTVLAAAEERLQKRTDAVLPAAGSASTGPDASTERAVARKPRSVLTRMSMLRRAAPPTHGVALDSVRAAFPLWLRQGGWSVDDALSDIALALSYLATEYQRPSLA